MKKRGWSKTKKHGYGHNTQEMDGHGNTSISKKLEHGHVGDTLLFFNNFVRIYVNLT